MKVIIEIKDKIDEKKTLEYFYFKCLDEPAINKFMVSIEGTELRKGRK